MMTTTTTTATSFCAVCSKRETCDHLKANAPGGCFFTAPKAKRETPPTMPAQALQLVRLTSGELIQFDTAAADAVFNAGLAEIEAICRRETA